MSKIEFIIPTYERIDHLMCLLNSLCAQSSNDWTAHVIADCPPQGSIDKIMKYFKGDDRIKFTILPERHNDWGHTPRNFYDNFGVLQGQKKQREFILGIIPDYLITGVLINISRGC